jgi:hypothetical protein
MRLGDFNDDYLQYQAIAGEGTAVADQQAIPDVTLAGMQPPRAARGVSGDIKTDR